MIELYCGKVGGGKSYCAVLTMLRALGAGRVVASNIKLCWSEVEKYCREVFSMVPDPAQYIYLEGEENVWTCHRHIPAGSLLVLDELNIYFPSRGYARNAQVAGEFLDWLVQSRKYGCDVIAIIQSPANLDAQIRRQALAEWHHSDTKQAQCSTLWGFGPSIRLGKFVPQMFARVKYWTGDYTESVASEFVSFDLRVGRCYETAAIFKSYDMAAGRVVEPMVVRSKTWVGRHKRSLAAVGVLLGCVGCMRFEREQARKLLLEQRRAIDEFRSAAESALRSVTGGVGRVAPSSVGLGGADPRGGGSTWPAVVEIDGIAGDLLLIGGARYSPYDMLPCGYIYVATLEGRILLSNGVSRRSVPYAVAVSAEESKEFEVSL